MKRFKVTVVLFFNLLSIVRAYEVNVEPILRQFQERFDNVSRQTRYLHSFEQYKAFLYEDPPITDGEYFDFIIVGSGSAGCLLANRLSEVSSWKILLLEVGEEAQPISDIPALAPLFQFTDYNWNYLSEKEDNINLALRDQRMPWPRGRALGGTSIINYMIHTRGNAIDYNRWAKLGNPGWSYKDVLKYFMEIEDATMAVQDREYHARGGALPVGDVDFRTPSVHAFVQAAQQAGHPYVDYNGKNQLGVSYVQATTRTGRRWSAERAFLRPILDRPNLKILTKARAVQILIDPQTKVTYGVKYVKNRKYMNAFASKEVVLSAGALSSPQLLMLSGIGPKAHLAELGIPLVQNLPVGEKLYDHITFFGLMFTVNQSVVFNQSDLYDPNQILRYIQDGYSPLCSLGGVEALAYIQTAKTSVTSKPYPDMELIFVAGSMKTDKGEFYQKTFHIAENVYNTVWKPLEDKYVWQVLPMLVHPKSYGHLKLKSKNPYHWPKFYGGYFKRREDIDTFIASIREIQRIASMPALQKYGTQIVSTKIPGCERFVFDSDEYWECALRHVTPTLHHQVATCKMGPINDREAVVDSRLRVYGVKNLRVADTSVIPIPLTAHTNIPAMMVGGKAADIIKEDWLSSNL